LNTWLHLAIGTGGILLGLLIGALLCGARENETLRELRAELCRCEEDNAKLSYQGWLYDQMEQYILERLDETVSLWAHNHPDYERGRLGAFRNVLLKLRGHI